MCRAPNHPSRQSIVEHSVAHLAQVLEDIRSQQRLEPTCFVTSGSKSAKRSYGLRLSFVVSGMSARSLDGPYNADVVLLHLSVVRQVGPRASGAGSAHGIHHGASSMQQRSLRIHLPRRQQATGGGSLAKLREAIQAGQRDKLTQPQKDEAGSEVAPAARKVRFLEEIETLRKMSIQEDRSELAQS